MSFRTVVIKNRAKLDYSMHYLVCRGEVETRIHLSEIKTLIIESTAVAITVALLSALVENKTKIIMCDAKHMPQAEFVGYSDNYHSSMQLKRQISWSNEIKDIVWAEIIKQKIYNQYKVMVKYNCSNAQKLLEYMADVLDGDTTNREGHSAKVYMHYMFGDEGRRVPNFHNSALNYGYSILLSAVSRELTALGCVLQLGIWHCNEYNHFNLACDIMEAFRPIVDEIVAELKPADVDYKYKLRNMVNVKVNIGGASMFFDSAIEQYVSCIIRALNEQDVSYIKQVEGYELPIYENISDV